MAKWVSTAVLDGALNVLKTTATRMDVTAAQPADRAAVVANSLATVTVATGDFTLAAGTGVSARKVTVVQKAGISVTATGTAGFVSMCDGVNLLYITTCTGQALTSGNTMTFGTWSVEIGDPV